MSQEAASDAQRVLGAALQLREEVVAVEVMQLLQVAEDHAPLAPQVLRHVHPLQLWEVVVPDVAQRAHVLPLGAQQLLQDLLQLPVMKDETVKPFLEGNFAGD